MRYGVFFQIEIVHSYFSRKPIDLIILPDTETTKLLSRRRFLIKRTVNGIEVLRGVHDEGGRLTKVEEDDVFVFKVFPTSNIVRELTDTSMVENGKMIFFTNEGLGKGNLELTKSKTPEEGRYQGFTAMAKVEIKGSKITSQDNVLPPLYHADFKSKMIKWKYYFISHSKTIDITIESRDEKLKFNELEIKDDMSDKIVDSLMLNFQDSQIFLFESNTDVPYSNKPIKDIKLMQNGAVLIKHLPNPAVQDQGIQIIKIK